MTKQEAQALQLLASTGVGMTPHANALMSRQISSLLASGWIQYDATCWCGFIVTPEGQTAICAKGKRP
jgi:hypothetical protein